MLLVLFALLLWRGLRAAARADDPFAFLLAGGLTIQLGLYALVNLAVATGLRPTTGLPLPFVSYGGSALLVNLAAAGLLYRVSAVNDAGARRSTRQRWARGQERVKVMIAGGGTGGHVYPGHRGGRGAEARCGRDAEVLFVGGRRGLEAQAVPEAGFRIRYHRRRAGFPRRRLVALAGGRAGQRRSGFVQALCDRGDSSGPTSCSAPAAT